VCADIRRISHSPFWTVINLLLCTTLFSVILGILGFWMFGFHLLSVFLFSVMVYPIWLLEHCILLFKTISRRDIERGVQKCGVACLYMLISSQYARNGVTIRYIILVLYPTLVIHGAMLSCRGKKEREIVNKCFVGAVCAYYVLMTLEVSLRNFFQKTETSNGALARNVSYLIVILMNPICAELITFWVVKSLASELYTRGHHCPQDQRGCISAP